MITESDCNEGLLVSKGGIRKGKKEKYFPGRLVVRIWGFHCGGLGLIPGWGTKISQAWWQGQKKQKTKNEWGEGVEEC